MCHKRFIFILIISYLTGCSKTADDVDSTDATGVSRSAARLYAIEESQTNVIPADEFQTRTSGTVLELPTNAVKIKNKAFPDGTTIAISPNVDVWLDGDKIQLSGVSVGDQVDLFSEQKGNRADGYQSLVTRINIAQSTDSEDGEIDSPKDYSIMLKGILVEANTNSVTIRDDSLPDAEPTSIPVVRLVNVTKHGESGGVSLLQTGDRVTLQVQSRGNRQDGYIDVATSIMVDADDSN